MDTPYQDLPQIPASLDGKLKMLREQFDIMMGVIRETLDAPFATEDNLEASILRNVAKDLENLGPEAFQAFEEVKGAHLALATEAAELAKTLPSLIEEAEKKAAAELACYTVENLTAPPEEPVPNFLKFLELEKDWSALDLLLREESQDHSGNVKPPVTSGNIWENWYSETQRQNPSKSVSRQIPEYRFPMEVLVRLGLAVEPEKQLPPGGNIWENWK